jgi:hypothetical protein
VTGFMLPQDTPMVDHALAQVALGYRVFPLSPGSKIPLANSHGFKDGTKDEQTIRTWFATAPTLNYGIALDSNHLIIDADPRNYPDGRDVLKDLIKQCPDLTPDRIVQTPNGGYHLYFQKDPDIKVRKKQPQFPGIDFLSDGAYVVGPGSSVDGKQYQVIG